MIIIFYIYYFTKRNNSSDSSILIPENHEELQGEVDIRRYIKIIVVITFFIDILGFNLMSSIFLLLLPQTDCYPVQYYVEFLFSFVFLLQFIFGILLDKFKRNTVQYLKRTFTFGFIGFLTCRFGELLLFFISDFQPSEILQQTFYFIICVLSVLGQFSFVIATISCWNIIKLKTSNLTPYAETKIINKM